ncbi:MAG: Holliday junction branch migration protein RuvA [Schleiferiaceae bacterium]|nr:Holliday junction branch migration protein RuvA [Schleiferiaceae bacterium]
MFHHFVGRVTEKSPAHIVLECGGIGYYLNISLTTFGQIGEAKEVKLLTHAVYREDAQLLFGFHTGVERDVFLLLLSVSGVGANTARMILSALRPNEAIQAISNGDSGTLQRIKGIGAKTAQRIVIDLRDKVGGVSTIKGSGDESVSSVRAEAIQALIVLGFSRSIVERIVSSILSKDGDHDLEDVLRIALSQL